MILVSPQAVHFNKFNIIKYIIQLAIREIWEIGDQLSDEQLHVYNVYGLVSLNYFRIVFLLDFSSATFIVLHFLFTATTINHNQHEPKCHQQRELEYQG